MKLSRWILLALFSLSIGMVAILYGELPPPAAKPILQPNLPFKHFVYGVGTVEPSQQIHPINPNHAGVIQTLSVKVGDAVSKGTELYQLDDRPLQAQLQVAEKTIALKQQQLNAAQHQFHFIQALKQQAEGAVSEKDFVAKQDAVKITQQALEQAKATKKFIESQIQQTHILAPFDGRIIAINCHTGQNSDACLSQGVMQLGTQALTLRVNIDEYDIPRFQPQSQAIAVVQGHPNLSVPMTFDHLEPKLYSKTQLIGKTTERTDTRVLQALYRLTPPKHFPIYIGQSFDVYIQAPAK